MSDKMNKEIDGNQNASLDERMIVFFRNYPMEDIRLVALCKEKAEASDHNAMLWLARMYRDGIGVRKNSSKAIELYKESKDHNIFSEFELLVMLSNRKPKFIEEDIPEGLKIDSRKRDKLFVHKFNDRSMKLMVKLFPFTHYNVVGFSYGSEDHIGYNEDCEVFDKILIANLYDSTEIKEDLISKGVPSEKIITVREYLDKDKFDGGAIICDFSDKQLEKKAWVVVPFEIGGLVLNYLYFKLFKGEKSSECDYVTDAKNHFSQMMDINNMGYYNPWDYYFKPASS